MRPMLTIVLTAATLVGLGACSAKPVALKDLPQRKAGLWRQTLKLEGSTATQPAIEACTDSASEAKLTLLGQHKAEDLCQDQRFTRRPDGSLAFQVSCDLGPHGKTVSTGTISGDFNVAYTIAMDSKTTGAPVAELNAERKKTITATWIGACKPGQRGGDMILPDGRTVNLTDPAPGPRFP